MDDLRDKIHEIDRSLASHLSECAQQNKQVWIEIRSFKRILWCAAGFGIGAPWTIIAWLLTNPLPWHAVK